MNIFNVLAFREIFFQQRFKLDFAEHASALDVDEDALKAADFFGELYHLT